MVRTKKATRMPLFTPHKAGRGQGFPELLQTPPRIRIDASKAREKNKRLNLGRVVREEEQDARRSCFGNLTILRKKA